MALRGVWQLQKLIVSYSDWGGSSRGIRAFMESHLPKFKEANPQLEVDTELIRGQHPHLKAFYKNKRERVVCVKNLDPEEVLLHATRLRNALGRKVVKLKTRHVTRHPSVQGKTSRLATDATVTAGMYCVSRYATDMGVRPDVIKVAVEDMAANLGWAGVTQGETAEASDLIDLQAP